MLSDIQEKYAAWYKIWCDVYVPKIMHQKKNFKNDRDLQVDDLVYYQKKEGHLDSVWVLGKIDSINRGRDGVIRKVFVKYFNSKENFPRITERSARTVIKIWSADDPDLHADLKLVQKRIEELRGYNMKENEEQGTLCRPTVTKLKCGCCCSSHCHVSFHNIYGSKYFHVEIKDTQAVQLATVEVASQEVGIETVLEENDVEAEDKRGNSLMNYLRSIGSTFN